jgi:putative tryptophan/tyrosine transport system substrate-binding protein
MEARSPARRRASTGLYATLCAVAFATLAAAGCGRAELSRAEAPTQAPRDPYRVAIVLDTVDDWSSGVRDGFIRRLDEALSQDGRAAVYTMEDTQLNPALAADILRRIRESRPELAVFAVYPNGFAAKQIIQQLSADGIPCLAMEATPLEDGTVASLKTPGGHVSGVGVFLQMNSLLRLARRIDPDLRRVYYLSWSAMAAINAWFDGELSRACAEEGWEFAGSVLVPDIESELEYLESFGDRQGIVVKGISAFVDRQGRPVVADEESTVRFLARSKALSAHYDPTSIQAGAPFGTTVVWDDIGAQLADMALRVFAGASPGSLPWEYPRSYNLMFNLPGMRRLGYDIPEDLLSAAYRIYTDYEGGYTGKVD